MRVVLPVALHADDDDFGQPRALWERVMTETDREHLVASICACLRPRGDDGYEGARRRVLAAVHPELGAQVGKGLDAG